MRMDTNSHLACFAGWPNTGALMRRLDDGSNKEVKKPGNMYNTSVPLKLSAKRTSLSSRAGLATGNLKLWG